MYNWGQYVPGNSIIHRLDPRIKILSVIVLSVFILKVGVNAGLLLSVFMMAVIFMSRLTFQRVITSLRPFIIFFILLFLLHVLFTAGTPIVRFSFCGLSITHEGLYRGLYITWQFMFLVTGASILTMTTVPSDLISGIEGILKPLRPLGVPTHDIAIMLSLALRFVPTFLGEIDRIKKAQMARGANFKKGKMIKKIKNITSLALPIVLSSFRRAEETATAMEGRGYKRGPRTCLRNLRMSSADYIALVLMVAMMTGIQLMAL
ncbi:MAG: energy-coupling factor transporter transmembrane protein EcfT [Syntrophobacterales bacterium]|nr:energy-coupling factor transporter transmembrane protein EcfT [Syntrophobacterales bacterium]